MNGAPAREMSLQQSTCDISGEFRGGALELEDTARDRFAPVYRLPVSGRPTLDHLTRAELLAHQYDLELATQIQSNLLPSNDVALEYWDTQCRYEPSGAVGGDYCELIAVDSTSVFFAVGDIAGKGVAASLLMAQLSAIFRTLLSLGLSLGDVVSRANELFLERTDPAHYATLVCGLATQNGIDLCNAGHCPAILLRKGATQRLSATGLPLGLFREAQYTLRHINLDVGDSLIMYSDGITEAKDPLGGEYTEERLVISLRNRFDQGTDAMADKVLQDVARFRKTSGPVDDLTLLIVRRRR